MWVDQYIGPKCINKWNVCLHNVSLLSNLKEWCDEWKKNTKNCTIFRCTTSTRIRLRKSGEKKWSRMIQCKLNGGKENGGNAT